MIAIAEVKATLQEADPHAAHGGDDHAAHAHAAHGAAE
jgi:hypothetical protein